MKTTATAPRNQVEEFYCDLGFSTKPNEEIEMTSQDLCLLLRDSGQTSTYLPIIQGTTCFSLNKMT